MNEKPSPKTQSERSRKFRERKRERDGSLAVTIARIVTGRDAGDGARTLAEWLREASGQAGLDDERSDLVDEAARLLERRRRI